MTRGDEDGAYFEALLWTWRCLATLAVERNGVESLSDSNGGEHWQEWTRWSGCCMWERPVAWNEMEIAPIFVTVSIVVPVLLLVRVMFRLDLRW
jgi:hypothetical protein